MSKFVNLLRNQSIRYESLKTEDDNLRLGLEEHRADGIMIYQKAADAQGDYVFYALNADALEDHKVRDYSKQFLIQRRFFQFSESFSRMTFSQKIAWRACQACNVAAT